MNAHPDMTKHGFGAVAGFGPRLTAMVLFWFAAATGLALAAADEGHEHQTIDSQSDSALVQTKCPVMPENDINPEIFSVYQGKKVFFCCQSCKAAFEKEPQKYLAGLPQFAATLSAEHGSTEADVPGHQHGSGPSMGFALYKLIKPAGVLTLLSLVTTVLLGVFRRKNPKLLFKWHKRLGVTTLVLALIHVTLIVIAH